MTRPSPLRRLGRSLLIIPALPLVFLWWLLIASGGPLQRFYSWRLRRSPCSR